MLFELLSFLGGVVSRPYAGHAIVLCIVLYALRVWSNGARNTRDRNMHGRVVVITVRPLFLLRFPATTFNTYVL